MGVSCLNHTRPKMDGFQMGSLFHSLALMVTKHYGHAKAQVQFFGRCLFINFDIFCVCNDWSGRVGSRKYHCLIIFRHIYLFCYVTFFGIRMEIETHQLGSLKFNVWLFYLSLVVGWVLVELCVLLLLLLLFFSYLLVFPKLIP